MWKFTWYFLNLLNHQIIQSFIRQVQMWSAYNMLSPRQGVNLDVNLSELPAGSKQLYDLLQKCPRNRKPCTCWRIFIYDCTVWKARKLQKYPSVHGIVFMWERTLLFARSNAQGTGFYLRLLLVPRSYFGPFSFLATRETSPWILDFMSF